MQLFSSWRKLSLLRSYNRNQSIDKALLNIAIEDEYLHDYNRELLSTLCQGSLGTYDLLNKYKGKLHPWSPYTRNPSKKRMGKSAKKWISYLRG